jgi:DNA-binding transcriptional regulator YiaG
MAIGNYVKHTISYEVSTKSANKSMDKAVRIILGTPMLTGAQIRAARAILRWSSHRLSIESGLAWGTIQNAEKTDGLPNMQAKNLLAVKTTLERAGIEFTNGDEPGLKMKAKAMRARKMK